MGWCDVFVVGYLPSDHHVCHWIHLFGKWNVIWSDFEIGDNPDNINSQSNYFRTDTAISTNDWLISLYDYMFHVYLCELRKWFIQFIVLSTDSKVLQPVMCCVRDVSVFAWCGRWTQLCMYIIVYDKWVCGNLWCGNQSIYIMVHGSKQHWNIKKKHMKYWIKFKFITRVIWFG